eukprot:5965739-Pleurochrysis_carterae.AAC.1
MVNALRCEDAPVSSRLRTNDETGDRAAAPADLRPDYRQVSTESCRGFQASGMKTNGRTRCARCKRRFSATLFEFFLFEHVRRARHKRKTTSISKHGKERPVQIASASHGELLLFTARSHAR